jgi:hypothetical protein
MVTRSQSRPARSTVTSATLIILVVLLHAGLSLRGAGQKFYADDPLAREPETQDASKVQEWDVVLTYDLAQNLFSRPGDPLPKRAGNLNTIDEVPDSNWFTNRILARAISIEEAVRGSQRGPAPARGQWTLVRPKSAGASPGFVLRDSAGVTWFVQFDAAGYPEAATGAAMVATSIFHTLGYWQTENFLTEVRPEDIVIGEGLTVRTPSGRRRAFNRDDVKAVFDRSARLPNGAYRMLASRALAGRPVGSFKYNGTRPDDPNDIVPHEHRRELRAMQVFGAWTNLVDMKAGNTLDVVVTENGKSVVRHYLQDVGSTFGTGALGPREYDEGYESIFEAGSTWKRLVSLGFALSPWQTVSYDEAHRSIGRFEGDQFDPFAWKPRVPMAALLHARADDRFWAARRVMAFSDDMIRAIVKTGAYSDAAAETFLADVLIKRRDRIGRAFLPAINPIVDPALGADRTLTFRNAAVDARVADPPTSYQFVWSSFDNVTGESQRIGEGSASEAQTAGPSGLPLSNGSFVRVDVSAVSQQHAEWARPIRVYFRREAGGWKLVGLERQPEN